MSVDPLASKYPSLSPYNYCVNNPVMLVDPDGKEVVATSQAAARMILHTLSKEDRVYVQFNEKGQINKSIINSANSASGNFQALQQLVNANTVFEVNSDNKFVYKDENGKTIKKDMGPIQQGDLKDSGPFSPKTGEVGWLGVTQTPGNSPEKYNSTDEKVHITVNSGLSIKARAQTFAHEGYGHAFLNSIGKKHTHQVKNIFGKFIETNKTLSKQIIERINETEKNYNSK